MKKAILGMVTAIMAFTTAFSADDELEQTAPQTPPPKISIDKLILKGKILDDENISFDLSFKVDAETPGTIPVASGALAKISSKISGGGFSFFSWGREEFSIFPDGGEYFLNCPESGKRDVQFSFFSKVVKNKAQRSTTFKLLPAVSRVIEITSPRKNIELKIPGALNVVKKDAPDGNGVVFVAALPPKGDFSISWRSQVSDLQSSLVTSVTPIITHAALPGAISTKALFNYKIIQGKLSEITLAISADVNVLSVKGKDIQDWNIAKTADGRELRVKLGREFDSSYLLSVSTEKILPKFPCSFDIPNIAPKNVLRVDGYLAVRAAGAVKLIIEKTSGLNQIDSGLFPVRLKKSGPLVRDLYTYRFSSANYSISANADNITPSYSAGLLETVEFKDEEVKLQAKIDLDVKDAPLRELTVEYPADLMVNRVSGRFVKEDDYDTIPPTKPGEPAKLKIQFAGNSIGKISILVECEKNIRTEIW